MSPHPTGFPRGDHADAEVHAPTLIDEILVPQRRPVGNGLILTHPQRPKIDPPTGVRPLGYPQVLQSDPHQDRPWRWGDDPGGRVGRDPAAAASG
jgi:hypothetical protein